MRLEPAELPSFECDDLASVEERYGRLGKDYRFSHRRNLLETELSIDDFIKLVARCDNGMDGKGANTLLINESTYVSHRDGTRLSRKQIDVLRHVARHGSDVILSKCMVDRELACKLRGVLFNRSISESRDMAGRKYLVIAIAYIVYNQRSIDSVALDKEDFNWVTDGRLASFCKGAGLNRHYLGWGLLYKMVWEAHRGELGLPNLFFEENITIDRLLSSLQSLLKHEEGPSFHLLSNIYFALAKQCIDRQQPYVSFDIDTLIIADDKKQINLEMKAMILAALEELVEKKANTAGVAVEVVGPSGEAMAGAGAEVVVSVPRAAPVKHVVCVHRIFEVNLDVTTFEVVDIPPEHKKCSCH